MRRFALAMVALLLVFSAKPSWATNPNQGEFVKIGLLTDATAANSPTPHGKCHGILQNYTGAVGCFFEVEMGQVVPNFNHSNSTITTDWAIIDLEVNDARTYGYKLQVEIQTGMVRAPSSWVVGSTYKPETGAPTYYPWLQDNGGTMYPGFMTHPDLKNGGGWIGNPPPCSQTYQNDPMSSFYQTSYRRLAAAFENQYGPSGTNAFSGITLLTIEPFSYQGHNLSLPMGPTNATCADWSIAPTRWVPTKGFRLFHSPFPGFAWRTVKLHEAAWYSESRQEES